MHSALKRDGVPLYKLARRGETVARAPRRIDIFELELVTASPPLLTLRVRCSKGTYVRTLAEDIGAALGSGAHLAALRRTACGRLVLREAAGLDALAALPAAARRERLLPLSHLLSDLPSAELDAAAEMRLRNGQALTVEGVAEGLCALYRTDGEVIGLGRGEAGGSLRPLRLTRSVQPSG